MRSVPKGRLPLKGGVILEACIRLLARFLGRMETLFPVYGVEDAPRGHLGRPVQIRTLQKAPIVLKYSFVL